MLTMTVYAHLSWLKIEKFKKVRLRHGSLAVADEDSSLQTLSSYWQLLRYFPDTFQSTSISAWIMVLEGLVRFWRF